jgi:hypothetical protein
MNQKFSQFEIIEWMCETPKSDSAMNEDRLIINDRFVAVIDGATPSGPINDVPGGIVAAQSVADALGFLPAMATVHEFLNAANSLLTDRIGDLFEKDAMSPSAAAVVWSSARNELWRIGDCHFRIDNQDYLGEKEVDRVACAFRCGVIRARISLGLTSVEKEREVTVLNQPFMPLVSLQHAFLNLDSEDPMAYGAINGSAIPSRFIEIYKAPFAKQIVLCSDGFVRPFLSLIEAITETNRLSELDPLMIYKYNGSRPFPAGSTLFDDTTYVRFHIK